MSASDLSPVKQALVELRELRSKLAALEDAHREPIAIVGMGCRLPGGATSPDRLWRLLEAGVDAIGEVPPDRWDVDDYYDADLATPGKTTSRWGGFIEGVDRFDAEFFGISPREAGAMDPQQRMLLEVAWEALEDAGHAPDRLAGTPVGVFVGISSFDYVHLAMSVPDRELGPHLAPGIAHSAASGRLAYILGLQGPAISVDTACSSSLTAIHLAVQSLRRRECDVALAGGVNAILLPTFVIGFSKSQMMATDGRCKTFDASADGFVRGEGCGIVVLKRLRDAVRDGDRVVAVVRGSATNQDGRSSGMTAPNGLAQEAVIRAALENAGIESRQVGYVEAHGTGTVLGDPVEVQALASVYGRDREPERPLFIGSLKSNLGHLEAAAGVAGVMKTALSLSRGVIPPSLHFKVPNPHVAWRDMPVSVVTRNVDFPVLDGRRVAGVSAFGFTGSNVHIVLEAPHGNTFENRRDVGSPAGALAADSDEICPAPQLLKLSARDESALAAMVDRWIRFLDERDDRFADLCHAAAVGRADLPVRASVVASSAAEARDQLSRHVAGEESPGFRAGRARPNASDQVAFLFTGHGAQYVGMGRELLQSEPVFCAAIERCDALLEPQLAHPLRSLLAPAPGEETDLAAGLLETMTYSQPALFAIEYALAELWRSWGVRPTAVMGHSVGEYAAAVVAGVLCLEDALTLVAARGRLMDSLPDEGAMLAIFTGEREVAELIGADMGRISIAAINGPTEVVVSGDRAAVQDIETEFVRRGVETRRLAVARAAHSHLLESILDEFEAVARGVRPGPPEIAFVSCTTGRVVGPAEVADPRYWRRHLRQPVRFTAGLETLRSEGCEIFLEIGPHTQLLGMGRRCYPEEDHVAWLPSLHRQRDPRRELLESLAALYARGVEIDWLRYWQPRLGQLNPSPGRVAIPTYPWQHRRYWLEHSRPEDRDAGRASPGSELWPLLLRAGAIQERQGPLDLTLNTFPARWRGLGKWTTAVVADALETLGVFRLQGVVTVADVVARTGVLPRYAPLVARWLDRLASAGVTRRIGNGRFIVGDPPAADTLAAAWTEAEAVCGDWPFMLDYLRRCATLLPAVVTGRANALETLFPEGSFSTADALYRDSVLPRYYNGLAGSIVSAFLAARPHSPPSVLEVGGGTGGTTSTILPLVDRARGAYLFTDVSDLFLIRATERFAEHEALSVGLFDVDSDPAAQGLIPGSFDLIIAANVIHATHDIRATLQRLNSLLAPGGLLLMIEVTSYLDWFDVSTALLEGWDRQDDGLRTDHPMLPANSWVELLHATGFEHATAFPSEESPAAVMAQHVLVAQAPADARAAQGAQDASRTDTVGARVRPDLGPFATAPREAALEFTRRVLTVTPPERAELLTEYVRGHVAALLRLDGPRKVDRRGRLMDLGLDSLLAVELRGRLRGGLDLSDTLPATLVFDYPTVEAIVGLLERMLVPAEARVVKEHATAPANGGEPALDDEALNALSDAEVEARLEARLQVMEARIP